MISMFITRNAMAAVFITGNALFRCSKSFPHSLTFSRKPSRVFFASASNYSDWRNAAEGTRDSRTDWAYDATNSRPDEGDRDSEMAERAKETMSEGYDRAKEGAQEMKDRTKEYAHDAKEKTKGYAHETKEDAKDAAGTMAEKAKEYARDTKETTKDAAGTVADKTKEGADRTGETLRNVGEKAKETVKGAWEATKDTTQKIKETVVGKDDDDDDDDRGEGAVVGDDIAELRRKEAGKGYGERKGY